VPDMPIWLNDNYYFPRGVIDGEDSGVGAKYSVVGVTTGPLPSGTGQACFDGLRGVTYSSELYLPNNNVSYRGRAMTVDGLGNRTCADLRPGGVSGGTFRTDFIYPTVSVASGPQEGSVSATPTPPFVLTINDTESGFGPNPARVSLMRSGGGTSKCLIGSQPGCRSVPQATSFPSHDGSSGLYWMEYSVVDQAGNWECCGNISYIIDNAPPVVSQFDVPSTLNVKSPIEGSFTVADNVALVSAVPTLSYGSLVFHSGSTFILSGSATATRSFTMGFPARCITSQPPTAISLTVTDLAKLVGTATHNYGAGQVEACGTAGNTPFVSTGWSGTPRTVSQASGTTLLLADVAVQGDNPVAPFSRAIFYYADGGVYRELGSSNAGLLQVGSTRRWQYSLVWDPSPYEPIGTVPLLVVFVDDDGDALSVASSVTVTP